MTDREQIQQILQCVSKPLQCVVHRKGFDYYLPIGKSAEVRDLARSLLRSKSLVYNKMGSFSAGPDNVTLFDADRKRFLLAFDRLRAYDPSANDKTIRVLIRKPRIGLATHDQGIYRNYTKLIQRVVKDVETQADNLQHNEKQVRLSAARVLGRMGVKNKRVAPQLVLALQDGDNEVRIAAATALIRIDASNKPALSTLLAMLEHADSEVRLKAAYVFAHELFYKHLDKSVVLGLRKALSDNDEDVRQEAVLALGKMKVPANEVVVDFTALLKDKSWHVRDNAALALGKLGRQGEGAIPALVQLINDKNRNVQDSAIYALGEMGTAARCAVPVLMRALAKDHLRQVAAEALLKIDPENKEAKAALRE